MAFRPYLRALALLCAAAPMACAAPQTSTLLIEDVTVVDVESGTTIPEQAVLVDGGSISAVGAAGSIEPTGATVVDGEGGFLIPGLWDMHAHVGLIGAGGLELSVLQGVTGVRDMGGGELQRVRFWQDRIASGELIGPTILTAGPILESRRWLERRRSAGANVKNRLPVGSALESRIAVDLLGALGVDFIKFRHVPSVAALEALHNSARARGLDIVGHEPSVVSVAEAARLGQRTIEHVPLFSLTLPGRVPSEEELAEIARSLVASGSGLVPTLVSIETRLRDTDELRKDLATRIESGDPRIDHLSPALLADWREQIDERDGESGELDWPRMLAVGFDQTQRLHRAGVPMMAGTDVGSLFVMPGWGIHDEMRAMVEHLGFSPAEALAAATTVPAEFLGLETGSIAPGQVADLVLLERNPLEDISNTQSIRTVIAGGRLISEAERRDRLAAIADDSDQKPLALETLSDPLERARLAMARGDYEAALADYSGLAESRELSPAEGDELLLARYNAAIVAGDSFPNELRAHLESRLERDLTPAERLDHLAWASALAGSNEIDDVHRDLLVAISELDVGDLGEFDRERWHGLMIEHSLVVAESPARAVSHRQALLPEGWETDARSLNRLAWWCFEHRLALEEAAGWARRSADLHQEPAAQANSLDTLAEILNAQGRAEQAVRVARRALELNPESAFLREQVDRFEQLVDSNAAADER